MAIRLIPEKTGSRLFCSSKWWGNPDMPSNMAYPMIDGYPLTFLCQIDCEDIAPHDPEGRLPHEGMLYFFAAVDEYLGYEVPHEPNGTGRWPQGRVVVKYVKSINMETFESHILLDEDDNEIAEPPLLLRFASCEDDAPGLRLLGSCRPERSPQTEDREGFCLLQVESDPLLGLQFPDGASLGILVPAPGEWRQAYGFLSV